MVAKATIARAAEYRVAVGDDESFCHSMRRWLNSVQFVPAVYHSAEEFLADPYNERFACLLVDVELGGMSGLEMRRQLTRQGCSTPVIFVTEDEHSLGMAEAESAGCVFLRKTVDDVDLIDAVRSAA